MSTTCVLSVLHLFVCFIFRGTTYQASVAVYTSKREDGVVKYLSYPLKRLMDVEKSVLKLRKSSHLAALAVCFRRTIQRESKLWQFKRRGLILWGPSFHRKALLSRRNS
jgi:hypothetical protein